MRGREPRPTRLLGSRAGGMAQAVKGRGTHLSNQWLYSSALGGYPLKYSLSIDRTVSGRLSSFLALRSSSRALTISSAMATIIFFIIPTAIRRNTYIPSLTMLLVVRKMRNVICPESCKSATVLECDCGGCHGKNHGRHATRGLEEFQEKEDTEVCPHGFGDEKNCPACSGEAA